MFVCDRQIHRAMNYTAEHTTLILVLLIDTEFCSFFCQCCSMCIPCVFVCTFFTLAAKTKSKFVIHPTFDSLGRVSRFLDVVVSII